MKILGMNYKLKLCSNIADSAFFGRHDAQTLIIKISRGMPQQQKESTVIHEIIEALNTILDLDIRHEKITALEAGLYCVLVDNGVALAPLLKGITET